MHSCLLFVCFFFSFVLFFLLLALWLPSVKDTISTLPFLIVSRRKKGHICVALRKRQEEAGRVRVMSVKKQSEKSTLFDTARPHNNQENQSNDV